MINRQCEKITPAILLSLFLVLTGIGNALATETDDLARATQNPVASLISLPFQNNTNFNFGPQEETQNIMNIQPVLTGT